MNQQGEKNEKKGIWASVKGAFVEVTPDGRDETAHATDVAGSRPPPAPPAPPAPRVVDDAAARKRLEASIEAAAPPGYVELQDTLSLLAESIPDEASRWKAAMKLAAKHGHSPEALLGDFDKCIGILEQNGREFEDEMQAQIKRKVGGRQASVERLDADIKDRQDKILQFQSEISRLSEQRGTETAAMAADEQKISVVKEGFTTAYRSVLEQLTDRRNKLASFGKVA